MGHEGGSRSGNTHMFTELIVVSVLHLVEIVLVQLPDERGKVRVLEHPRQNRLCELVHVLDDKTVASGTPRHDMLEVGIFEHSAELSHGQPLASKLTKERHTCRASSRNQTWKTWSPRWGRVSTRAASRSTPGVLCGTSNGTPASLGELSGRVPLSGWAGSAMGVGRTDGRTIQGKGGGDRGRIWSLFERWSLSGGG